MEFMTVEEVLDSSSVYSTPDVPYIPLPNNVDVIISDRCAPAELNKTTFLMAFDDNGNVVLADDVKRGPEVPGGHIEPEDHEPGKRYRIASANGAIREAAEEAGIVVGDLTPLGIFRSHTTAEKPEGYRYPFPTYCQQFFVGMVERIDMSLLKKADSHGPIVIAPEEAEAKLQAKEFVLYKHAMATLFPALAVEHGFVEASRHP